MTTIQTSLLVFAFAFGGALLGVYVRRLLPADHLSPDSKDVLKLGMGLVATTVALVLGLLVASAKNFYDTQSSEVTQLASNAVLVDRLLAQYGPETVEIRAVLRGAVQRQAELMWPHDGSRKTYAELEMPAGDLVIDQIAKLSPKDDKQRALQAQVESLAIQTAQLRLLLLEQRRVPVPKALLVTLIFWLIALFMSFGLVAPSNLTAIGSLLIAAASVAVAIFLILEFYNPYAGLIQVPEGPVRAALAVLGK